MTHSRRVRATSKPGLLVSVLLAAVGFAVIGCDFGIANPSGGGQGTGRPLASLSACELVTGSEISTIFGVQMRSTDTGSNSCTWTATGGLPSVVVHFQPTDLAGARKRLGNPDDIVVAGARGVVGAESGISVYVTHGDRDLVVQSVLLADTPANRNKVIAVATKALSRAS